MVPTLPRTRLPSLSSTASPRSEMRMCPAITTEAKQAPFRNIQVNHNEKWFYRLFCIVKSFIQINISMLMRQCIWLRLHQLQQHFRVTVNNLHFAFSSWKTVFKSNIQVRMRSIKAYNYSAATIVICNSNQYHELWSSWNEYLVCQKCCVKGSDCCYV
jgi:hypothetical protein